MVIGWLLLMSALGLRGAQVRPRFSWRQSHVFDDAPMPTGLRHRMNGSPLAFRPTPA
jgi:hypothetical protein